MNANIINAVKLRQTSSVPSYRDITDAADENKFKNEQKRYSYILNALIFRIILYRSFYTFFWGLAKARYNTPVDVIDSVPNFWVYLITLGKSV